MKSCHLKIFLKEFLNTIKNFHDKNEEILLCKEHHGKVLENLFELSYNDIDEIAQNAITIYNFLDCDSEYK